jgi:hypothetical protein
MKKIILSLTFVGGMLACSADLSAFTAVTSGSWSSAATWGGIAPGSNVTGQDINIPSGITVTLDMDVQFNGLLNSFTVNGTLDDSPASEVWINAGAFTGSGSVSIEKLALSGLLTTYTYSGTLTLGVLRVDGPTVALTSQANINDTLDLEQGTVLLNSGGDISVALDAVVHVNDGMLVAGGGTFTALDFYDVHYVGGTKNSGEEISSPFLRDVHMELNSNINDVVLASNIYVNGLMHMQSGNLRLNGNTLHLNGDFSQDSGNAVIPTATSTVLVDGFGNMATTMWFDTAATLGTFIVLRDSGMVHMSGSLTIATMVHLGEGILVVDTMSTLIMGPGSLFSVDNGAFYTSGTFDGTQLYNVEYVGRNTWTGPELTGSGLNDVRIEQRNNYHMVYLMNDLVIPGTFNLQKGSFNLNGYDLEFQGMFDQEDTTAIWGNPASTLTLSMSASVNDTLWPDLPAIGIKNLNVDLPAGSTFTIGRNLTVGDTLNLMGGKLKINNANLTLGGGGVILGADETRYIITDGNGVLRLYMNANDTLYTLFPIGTTAMYTPAEFQQTVNGDTGYVRVRVQEGVWTDGYTGSDVSTSQSVVNKTWVIDGDSAVDLNNNVRLGWTAAAEMNGFDRTQSYIKHYTNMMWDSYATSAATQSGTYYWSERMAVADPGSFAVVDFASPLSVTEPNTTALQVYPNPTSDFVTLEVPNPAQDMMQYQVYDAFGKLVYANETADARTQIDFRNYEYGTYTLRITNLVTQEVVTRVLIKS